MSVHDFMCVNSRNKGVIRIGNSETGNMRERRKERAVEGKKRRKE